MDTSSCERTCRVCICELPKKGTGKIRTKTSPYLRSAGPIEQNICRLQVTVHGVFPVPENKTKVRGNGRKEKGFVPTHSNMLIRKKKNSLVFFLLMPPDLPLLEKIQ